MIRMEIALFLVMGMLACIYFTSQKPNTKLHQTFSILLVVVLIHLAFDGITVYTVNHLETIPLYLNNIVHRIFMGSMALVVFLFYRYISILVKEETGKEIKIDIFAWMILIISELGEWFLPITYTRTMYGNYSDGAYTYVIYASIAFYLVLCVILLFGNFKKMSLQKKSAMGIALIVEFVVCILQGIHHTWLISGMGISLMTLSFYLTLENPERIRLELMEEKMSMLYLKSQINPHFLYNTLDTIRIQAQLNEDNQVADLLMHLSDFFRKSAKVNQQMIQLDDELELLEAYMDLMCYRYPTIQYECDIDPDLGGIQVPNFILQPLVENSLLHGLKNKGYKGKVIVSAKKIEGDMLITIRDTGSGFETNKKEMVDDLLKNYAKKEIRLEGNSVGILNVQKRIKLLCGKEYGLWYTENEVGVCANVLLPLKEILYE